MLFSKFPQGAAASRVWLRVSVPVVVILHQAFAPLLARALHVLLAVMAFQFSFETLSPAEHMAAS